MVCSNNDSCLAPFPIYYHIYSVRYVTGCDLEKSFSYEKS